MILENLIEGNSLAPITSESLENAKAAMRKRTLNNRASELARLRANGKKPVPLSWGENERSVWGQWESRLAAYDKGFAPLLPRRTSLAGYLQARAKGNDHFSILEIGGTAGQLSRDIHAVKGLEEARIVGASLTDPRTEGVDSESAYKPLPNHDIIVADAFSPEGYSGKGSLGGFGKDEEELSIGGMSSIRNTGSPDGKFSVIVVKMEKPMLGLSTPEEMQMVHELVLNLYEKNEAGGVILLQLPERFPTKKFIETVRHSKMGKHIDFTQPHKSLMSPNMLIERKPKSPDSLRAIFEKEPLVTFQSDKKKN